MKKFYYLSMYILFILAYINELFPSEISKLFLAFSVVMLVLSALSITRGFQLWVSLLSLAIGHFVLFYNGYGLDIWLTSITKTVGIPVLFVCIPLIGYPMRFGGYADTVSELIKKFQNKPRLVYCLLSLFLLIMTIPLNIGAIPTLNKLLEKSRLSKRFLSGIYTAGYSSYMMFSPFDGVVNLVLGYAGIVYGSYTIYGIFSVLFIILVSLVIMPKSEFTYNLSENNETSDTDASKKAMILVINIFILIFISAIIGKGNFFRSPLFIIAPILAIYSFIWSFAGGHINAFRNEIKKHKEQLLSYKSFIPFLISTNFLGAILGNAKDSIGFEQLISKTHSYPLYLLLVIIISMTVLLSMVGVHMMISVTMLGIFLSPELLGLSGPAFAVSLLMCWVAAMAISPFTPFTNIVGEAIDSPGYIISKYNFLYTLIIIITGPLLIIGVNMFY